MTHPRLRRIGDLQLQIMKVLWQEGQASVAQVHQSLSHPSPLAYTTVATMLRKMEARGLVAHHADGRTFIYRARVPAEAVTRSMSSDLLDRLFEGSMAAMVSHLLTTREISRGELAELQKLIAAKQKKS